jgi:hypothetical protein
MRTLTSWRSHWRSDDADTRHLAQFDAVRNAVASGRMRPDEAAAVVERSVFPEVQATRDRCEALGARRSTT